MAIDFNGANNNALNPQKGGVRQRDNTQAETPQNPKQPEAGNREAAQGTRVNLSPDAQNIKAAEKALQEQPDIDDEKVSELREALENGSFSVDAEKLAQKMLDVDQSIFG